MLSNKTAPAMETPSASPNPLDAIPDQIPFDVPYGRPILLDEAQAAIHAAVAEAKTRNWKMNIAVADSGGNLLPSSEWMARCSPQLRSRNTRRAQLPPSGAKQRSSRTDQYHASQLSARIRRSHCVARRHSADRARQTHRRNWLFRRHDSQDEGGEQGRRGSHQ